MTTGELTVRWFRWEAETSCEIPAGMVASLQCGTGPDRLAHSHRTHPARILEHSSG